MEHNILHPDVIVDTDNLTECSSGETPKAKRKLSTSTDGDSTNYELIEYLKRREKRDEELLKRMDAREERLVNLLERTVVAIEALVQQRCSHTTTPATVAPAATETETEVPKIKLTNGKVKVKETLTMVAPSSPAPSVEVAEEKEAKNKV